MQDSKDQRAIRALVSAWMSATSRGDTQAVLDLMTDDAVFLVAGKPPITKAAFSAASSGQVDQSLTFEGISDIKEIHVEGAMAYMWSHLTVTTKSKDGATADLRSGHTLTVFRKIDERWRLARDANLLVKS